MTGCFVSVLAADFELLELMIRGIDWEGWSTDIGNNNLAKTVV